VAASGESGPTSEPYYRSDLALVHHRGFAFHAEQCAPGVLALLEPVLERGGLVLELGCGSGLLTERLVEAGHRVVASDASPAMLELTREMVGDRAQEIRRLRLPDDPLPAADAIVGIGHPLNYLPDAVSIEQALVAIAAALRPAGLLAFDVCDLEWGRRDVSNLGRVGADWAIITEFSVPSPDRFVREMTTFVANGDGTWRRDDERHENVLIDTATVSPLLSEHGVDAEIRRSFGSESLPPGLHVVLGRRPGRTRRDATR
jgi:SAM-dependent methyltransferase